MIKLFRTLLLSGLTISFGTQAQPQASDNYNVIVGSNPPAPPPITQTMQNPPQTNQGYSNIIQQGSPAYDNGEGVSPEAKDGIDMLVPLTPREIRYLNYKMQSMQKAKAMPFKPPERKIRTLVLEQEPGKKPPSIFMYQGHSTTLVLVDGEGQPWPVNRYKIGNPSAYTVTSADQDESSHILDITPVAMFIPTNLTVILDGNPMPIVFDLESLDNRTDSLVTVKVGGISSTNKNPQITKDEIPDIIYNNALLSPFLDNTPPDGAIVVTVMGDPDMSVWYWKDHFIVRTKYTLTNPTAGQDGRKISTPDGLWNVYEVSSDAPPIFSLINNNGDFMRVTVAVDEVTYK